MEAFFTVLGFFTLMACLFYITVFVQENGLPVLFVFVFPFILVWMGLKAAYEWFEFNFL